MILFLTNNEVTAPLKNWLVKREEVCTVSEKLSLSALRTIAPQYIVSYNYLHIITPDIIQWMDGNIVNLHISYLPWNKGTHPNFWAFLEETPHGVTIHQIDAGLDTGGIYAQQELWFSPSEETFQSSYQKLHEAIQQLFCKVWPDIKSGALQPVPQIAGGSFHKRKDLEPINSIFPIDWNMNVQTYLEEYRRHLS